MTEDGQPFLDRVMPGFTKRRHGLRRNYQLRWESSLSTCSPSGKLQRLLCTNRLAALLKVQTNKTSALWDDDNSVTLHDFKGFLLWRRWKASPTFPSSYDQLYVLTEMTRWFYGWYPVTSAGHSWTPLNIPSPYNVEFHSTIKKSWSIYYCWWPVALPDRTSEANSSLSTCVSRWNPSSFDQISIPAHTDRYPFVAGGFPRLLSHTSSTSTWDRWILALCKHHSCFH